MSTQHSHDDYQNAQHNTRSHIVGILLDGQGKVIGQQETKQIRPISKIIGKYFNEVFEVPKSNNLEHFVKIVGEKSQVKIKKSSGIEPGIFQASISKIKSSSGSLWLVDVYKLVRHLTTDFVNMGYTPYALMNAITKTSITGFVVCDSEKRVIWVNNKFEAITGYQLSELKGKPIGSRLQGKQTNPETVNFIRQMLEKGEDVDVELLNYTKDGVEYWNHLLISPIYHGETLAYFIGIQHDITDKKASIKRHMHQSRLSAVAQLSAKVCHDINNIMMIISGNTQMLTLKENREEQLSLMDNISKATQRASIITKGLLGIVRSESESPKSIEINQILRLLIEDLPTVTGTKIISSPEKANFAGSVCLRLNCFFDCLENMLVFISRLCFGKSSMVFTTRHEATFNPRENKILNTPSSANSYIALCYQTSPQAFDKTIENRLKRAIANEMIVDSVDDFELALLIGHCSRDKLGLIVNLCSINGFSLEIWLPVNNNLSAAVYNSGDS